MRCWYGLVCGVAVVVATGAAVLWSTACVALCEPYCECDPCVPTSRRASTSISFSPESPQLQDALGKCLADDLRCGELCDQLLGPLPPNTTRTVEQCYLTEEPNGNYRAHAHYLQRTSCPDPYDCPVEPDAAQPDAVPPDAAFQDPTPSDAGAADAGAADAGATDAGATDATLSLVDP